MGNKMESKMENAVKVLNLSKSFNGQNVVRDISFDITKGEVFGLIGPNGAGKTTIIRMLLDIIRPDSGEIRILNDRLSEETKNLIGYLPEERGLYKKLTVFETLKYLGALKEIDSTPIFVSRLYSTKKLPFSHQNIYASKVFSWNLALEYVPSMEHKNSKI
jgi:ABC-2 type transport system ATP-binding protein